MSFLSHNAVELNKIKTGGKMDKARFILIVGILCIATQTLETAQSRVIALLNVIVCLIEYRDNRRKTMNIQRVNSIEDELIYLRKNTGFTLDRFNDLLTLPIVLGGENQPFMSTKIKFIITIKMLDDKQAIDGLMVAFGIRKDYETIHLLKMRRKKHQEDTGLDMDRILQIEKAAIRSLARLLCLIEDNQIDLVEIYQQTQSDDIKVYAVFNEYNI